ncbi:MAG: hypothetical protein JW850_21480 [Thermoflexales bacterium]|nr:hypothetical protein [Thermoflexales bacterium]
MGIAHLWRGLTRRQKSVLSVLGVANLAVLALVFIVLRASTTDLSPPPQPDLRSTCGSLAARLLAQRHIAGSASIDSDNVLHLRLTGLDIGGQPFSQPSDVAWDALAAAVSLPQQGCGPYPRVQVDVPVENDPATIRLLVSVNWLDLHAWGYGELDDEQLAERAESSLYAQPSLAPKSLPDP